MSDEAKIPYHKTEEYKRWYRNMIRRTRRANRNRSANDKRDARYLYDETHHHPW